MATRNRRRRRDSSGHLDPYFQRRKRYEAVLGAVGLWDAFARLPRRVQELFWKWKGLDPILVFDQTVPDETPADRAIRRAIETAFRTAAIEIDCGDGAHKTTMNVRDFFAVIGGCRFAVQVLSATPRLLDDVAAFVRQAQPILDRFHDERMLDAMRALYEGVAAPVISYSRLDTRVLSVRLERTAPTGKLGKCGGHVVIRATEPEMRRVRLDGAVRPMYRVATTEPGGLRWLNWTGAQLGVIHPERAKRHYPVFVQSHALARLRERVNLPAVAPYLEAWLAESLDEPRIVQRQRGRDLLVEYRIKEHRLGYLIVTPMADLVAVRTFKFLTMDDTPEARLLKRRLRLTREEIKHTCLSDLETFTLTDLRSDPELRPLLEACGCDGLFALADETTGNADFAPPPKPFAAELKRYLRMAS